MSLTINETLAKYASRYQRPLMFIASRNQVDAASGYVMTTQQLAEQISPWHSEFVMLCRDHCGPYFLDSEKALSLSDAIEATKKTIAKDIENGFNLIHIDTSRCENEYKVAEDLIEFCLKLNPNILLEFGTEENVGVAASVAQYAKDVAFASGFANMRFVVAQTGSLTYEDRQAGTFNIDTVAALVNLADNCNIKLKEHNADYLTAEQIQLRKKTGVHALNIAPQLGVIQTKCVLALADVYGVDSTTFKETVVNSKRWAKWTESSNKELQVAVAGHYCFGEDSYLTLEDKLSVHCDVVKEIEQKIIDCLDLYYTNLY